MEKISRLMNVKYGILYFFIFCPLGIICPLIGQYLSHIGFSGTQVGIITSLGTGVAIFAGVAWGEIYSNSKRKCMMIAFMCVSAAVFGVAGTFTKSFIIYAVIYSVMYFFQGPVHGLCDSLILSKKGDFSFIRSFGAVGYALAVFFAGKFAEATGIENIFYLYAAAFIAAAVIVLTEKEPAHYKKEEGKIKSTVLLENKEYVKLIVCAFFVMGTNVANSTYFGYLFREGGGTIAGIGTAFLLMAGSEAPFMALIPVMKKKFTSEQLILFAMVLSAVRFAFYATGPDCQLLLGTFFLQGISNGILLVELVKYVDKLVKPEHNGVAIAVYYAVGNNLSIIICSLIGGVILDWAGAGAVYGFFSIYNVVAVVLFAWAFMRKKKAV